MLPLVMESAAASIPAIRTTPPIRLTDPSGVVPPACASNVSAAMPVLIVNACAPLTGAPTVIAKLPALPSNVVADPSVSAPPNSVLWPSVSVPLVVAAPKV